MYKDTLIEGLKNVEEIALKSKFQRLLSNPWKYFNAIFFREFLYKKTKKSKQVIAKTFFGRYMKILLPSSTDIYLTGGKSHNSEIRLAKFIIEQLNVGDTFIDVGAHYGYFSLLASEIVGEKGKVIAFEASPTTFGVLKDNIHQQENSLFFNKAVSDITSTITFYEFPALYSEYNTLDVSQFNNEDWFTTFKPQKVEVETMVLGNYLEDQSIVPQIIKIDVEGAEFKVINGLSDFLKLQHQSPSIVMEYLCNERGNVPHKKAEELLKQLGFKSHIINNLGKLELVLNIPSYLNTQKMESDNIVFVKQENTRQ